MDKDADKLAGTAALQSPIRTIRKRRVVKCPVPNCRTERVCGEEGEVCCFKCGVSFFAYFAYKE